MSPFPRPVPWRGRSSTAAKPRDREKWQLSAISFDLDLRRVAVEVTVAVPTHEITDYVVVFLPFLLLRAGVGRTGTFIGLWNLMDAVDARPESNIDVYQAVFNMRKDRPIMVQSIVRVAQ